MSQNLGQNSTLGLDKNLSGDGKKIVLLKKNETYFFDGSDLPIIPV